MNENKLFQLHFEICKAPYPAISIRVDGVVLQYGIEDKKVGINHFQYNVSLSFNRKFCKKKMFITTRHSLMKKATGINLYIKCNYDVFNNF